MTRIARIVPGAIAAALVLALILAVALALATWLTPRPQQAGGGRIYSVAQFVQTGVGPLWTTRRKGVFFIRGVLRPAPMQPIADFILTSTGQGSSGSGGLALTSAPSDALLTPLFRVAFLRSLLPHTPDNPVLGALATYRVVWTGCPSYGCSRSPWQLDSGGE